ncbi:hypothetical protein [Gymnodinialimonas ulvae]|uniref:hypothetical protein n=1 Tax=Gymnodinialimonas ulvae TaxID=3126504 RepID=UPI0030969598
MQALAVDPTDTLAKLDSLVASGRLPSRDAARCADLAEALRKPVRVCLMGPAQGDLRTIVYGILGTDIAPDGLSLPSAIEMGHGARVQTLATLEDGTHLACDGWPDSDLLAEAPVFLQLDAPIEALRLMSFLALSLEANPSMHRPALSWAARRTDIAVWCTPRFSVVDARIWANAPERLTHRAYLVETQPSADVTHHEARRQFAGYMQLPLPGDIDALLHRLRDDIDEARMADVDAAHVLLHRLGHLNADVAASEAGVPARLDATARPPLDRSHGQLARLRDVLSEPTLFLARRARALAEDLAWTDPGAEPDWPQIALTHVAETTEALRDRAADWPDDLPEFIDMTDMIEEATDLVLLLQMEAGPDQVEDAAGLLHQLRQSFDMCRLGRGAAA